MNLSNLVISVIVLLLVVFLINSDKISVNTGIVFGAVLFATLSMSMTENFSAKKKKKHHKKHSKTHHKHHMGHKVNKAVATQSHIDPTKGRSTPADEGEVPRGTIVMWAGELVPSGWALCDGTNQTPDLRGKFIVGSGQGVGLSHYGIGDVGGAEGHVLDATELPPHSHQYWDTQWMENANFYKAAFPNSSLTPVPSNMAIATDSKTTAGYDAGYDQDNVPLGSVRNTQQTGNGKSIDLRPPYYALAFIMKL